MALVDSVQQVQAGKVWPIREHGCQMEAELWHWKEDPWAWSQKGLREGRKEEPIFLFTLLEKVTYHGSLPLLWRLAHTSWQVTQSNKCNKFYGLTEPTAHPLAYQCYPWGWCVGLTMASCCLSFSFKSSTFIIRGQCFFQKPFCLCGICGSMNSKRPLLASPSAMLHSQYTVLALARMEQSKEQGILWGKI